MCLMTSQKEPETLEKALTVYKLIEQDNLSLFFSMHYDPNQTYHTDMKWDRFEPDDPIEADYRYFSRATSVSTGFHAYLSQQRAIEELVYWPYSVKLVSFVMPKGAKVFRNMNADTIVSDTIISGDLRSLSKFMGH